MLGSGIAHAEGGTAETSVLVYSEQQRINARAIAYSWTKRHADESVFGYNVTYDAMTGASPTGAAPSIHPQTVTGSSGRLRTEVPANTIPKNDKFQERRLGLSMNYAAPVTPLATLSAEGSLSTERDFTSFGLSGGLSQGFGTGRTTLDLHVGVQSDLSRLPGGNPLPLTEVRYAGDGNDAPIIRQAGRKKLEVNALIGIAQELSRKTVVRANYTVNYASGYLNDPYKMVSQVRPADSTDPGEPETNIYEQRPATRLKQTAFVQLKTYIVGMIMDASARGFLDDWGVRSLTGDLYYRFDFHSLGALEPHVRGYYQSAARFYRPYLVSGEVLPSFVSADSRLAEFSALTLGLSYSIPVTPNSRLQLAAENYRQFGLDRYPQAFGNLRSLTLFPELRALMVRVGLVHTF